MAFDKPQSRNEAILQNMLGANNELEPPKSRVEALLQDIAGQMPEANPSEGTTTGTLERLKIGDDIYTVEGGGSGTSDYDALNNKPQIAGVTLSGDKSLADLGIASATTVSGILDGTDIDSFGDVETALGDKVDKVVGKGLSTNDYDDTEKAAVSAATTAIAGIKDGTTIDSFGDVETALGAIQDGQSIDSFADVESAIGAIEDGATIDSFADVESALADKQDATDSNLQTTADTIVGAINEHEGDIASLKSGLTNVDVALALPENTGKNVLPYTLTSIKQNNSSGTWVDNAVTINGVTFTITASEDKVTKISATRVSASESNAILELADYAAKTGEILSGCPSGGSNTTYKVYCRGGSTGDFGEGATIAAGDVGVSRRYSVVVFSTSSPTNLEFYPMIRPAAITDATFAPYIPSVESRLEAVESGLDEVQNGLTNIGNQIVGIKAGFLASSTGDTVYIPAKVYPRVFIVLNNQGTDGTNGRPTIVGVLSMGTNGAYKFEQITNVTEYALTFTYDNVTDPDNPVFAVQYIKVSDSTAQAYLRGFYLTADLRWRI